MKNLLKRFGISNLFILLIASTSISLSSCEKIDESKNRTPIISFESGQVTVSTQTGKYDLIVKLSSPAQKETIVKVNLSGTAIENEHYAVASKEIKILAGASEGKLPITLMHDNIWENNLELRVVLSPGTSYVIDPKSNPEIKIVLTKEIVLPILSFDSQSLSAHTNPYNAQLITFNLKLDQQLRADAVVNMAFEGDMTIGADFFVNGGSNNKFTIAKSSTTASFTIKIHKKDAAGFNKNLKITLSPADNKLFTVSAEKSSYNLKVSDPLVDFSPVLRTAALLSGQGFQIYQAIKATDGSWSGNVTVNMGANTAKKNYLKTFRNMSFNTAFGCESNSPGGDILRMAELLNFANTDTVIADYGVGKTTRYFSPSDSLLRFVADGENSQKGAVYGVNQKLKAKLVVKADWETGTNGNKQWHLDSKATGGKIENSNYPTFATIEIEIVKIEGTYDFTLATPEIYFDAWFKSTSPYFMKNLPANLAISKSGDQYKISYRYIPR